MKGFNEYLSIDEHCECNDLYEDLEITESEYQGKKVKLNDPIRTSENPNKKFKVYVKNEKGKVVVVRFGDPNMKIKKNIPERKRNYCARSGGQGNTTNKLSANYWSRRQWNCT